MSSQASNKRNWALPKFGEWDVNNPASAEGYTVIFNNARDKKKDKSAGSDQDFNQKNNGNQRKRDGKQNQNQNNQQNVQNKWLCCFFGESSKTAK